MSQIHTIQLKAAEALGSVLLYNNQAKKEEQLKKKVTSTLFEVYI